jgi:acetylornithine deacetylase
MRATTTALLLCSALLPPTLGYLIGGQIFQHPLVNSAPEERISHESNTSPPPPYRDSLLSFHKDLIDIPSTLGDGSEDEVARFLAKHLAKLGYATELQLVPPRSDTPPDIKRYNVLAWPGASSISDPARVRKPRLLVTSHIDVVPPYIPYAIDAGEIDANTVIRGRGSVDAKASIAAQVTAVEDLLAAGKVRAEDLMLLYVIGEETTGDGMKHFSASLQKQDPKLQFEAAIFGEPTENKLACGHKGITVGWIHARGKAGHSGYPLVGKSATELLTRVLVKIADADLGSSERYGNSTFNIGRLTGGVAANVIAEEAGAMVSVRIAGGNFTTGFEIVKKRIMDILKETDEEAFTLDLPYGYGPVKCDCDIDGKPSQPYTLKPLILSCSRF